MSSRTPCLIIEFGNEAALVHSKSGACAWHALLQGNAR